MQKPDGYDEAKVSGERIQIRLGGHHCVIKQVTEKQSKTGKDMIVVLLDFDKADDQPDLFGTSFKNDDRPEKKWPFNGTQYINTMDSKDKSKTSKSFKSFITAFERSNNVTAVWGDNFCDQFKGKKIGGVFGVVEEEYNGEVKKRHRLRWFCEDNRADSASVPEPKLLNKPSTGVNDFVNVPDGTAEEIPF